MSIDFPAQDLGTVAELGDERRRGTLESGLGRFEHDLSPWCLGEATQENPKSPLPVKRLIAGKQRGLQPVEAG